MKNQFSSRYEDPRTELPDLIGTEMRDWPIQVPLHWPITGPIAFEPNP